MTCKTGFQLKVEFYVSGKNNAVCFEMMFAPVLEFSLSTLGAADIEREEKW